MPKAIKTIDEYIACFSNDVAERLKVMRTTISQVASQATEKICWNMPTFYLNGNLVHFAAQKNHIGFYPAPSAIEAFSEQLKDFKTSKGAVQFPHNLPLPLQLIRLIVEFRVNENNQISVLTKLPNIGTELEKQLNAVGITTFDQLLALGSKKAWLKILAIDNSACYSKLCSLEGAIRNLRWHNLPSDIKNDLKIFYNTHKSGQFK